MFPDLAHAKYTTIANDIQPSFIGADSSKQCAGIYPAPLAGGRWPPGPRRAHDGRRLYRRAPGSRGRPVKVCKLTLER